MPSTILFILAMISLLIPLIWKSLPETKQQTLFTVGWLIFALFWASRFEYYVFKTRSFIYLLLVPTTALFCVTLASSAIQLIRTRTQTPTEYKRITIGATVASLLYMPFTLISQLREASIELVAVQTFYVIKLLEISNVTLGTGPEFGYESALIFTTNSQILTTYIAPNCTGIGSMAVVVAILWITNRTTKQKLLYSILSVGLIHILNIGRNVMIAIGFGKQWFAFLEPTIAPLMGYNDPNLVSFFIVDKIFAQLGSAIVLLILFYYFLQWFPELQTTIKNLITLFKTQYRQITS